MVGDMISVIDMPPPEESIWWRGKRGFQVGFFPCECVQVIGDKVPSSIHSHTLTLPPTRGTTMVTGTTTTVTTVATSTTTTTFSTLPGHGIHSVSAPDSPHDPGCGAKEPLKPVLRKHGKLIAFFRSFILSRPSRRKLKQSGILRERVFGCDLGENLMNSGNDIPMVLKCCSQFIETHGTVDGIYRLSGITSNIQKLRNAFDEERIPDLYGDESILQDIHCVSSLLKMYFRELPNPLLTYQLYDKFAMAVMQEEEVRLFHIRDVVQQLPPPHYRTLEYLVRHLSRIAAHSTTTGMTPKNIAIVWAPNLLRSKDLEKGGVAALQDVGTQAVVTEYLIRYVDLIFNDKFPNLSPLTRTESAHRSTRPKSLAISTPTKLISIEEARNRTLATLKTDQSYIEVGGGPQSLPKTYHTIIDLPSRKGGSLKHKKSPSGWKTLFSKSRYQRKASTPSEVPLNTSDSAVLSKESSHPPPKKLRPVKSVESLVSTPISLHSTTQVTAQVEKQKRPLYIEDKDASFSDTSSPLPSPRTHSRSVSHDSYFNLLERSTPSIAQNGTVKEERESDVEFSPDSPKISLELGLSELNMDFNTSEPEMRIFSEDETLQSTSLDDTISRSTVDMENISMGSDCYRSKDSLSSRERRTLKDKLRHTFSSSQKHNVDAASIPQDDSRNNSLKRASIVIKDKISHALTPETIRKKDSNSTHSLSPSSSPKIKHKKVTEPDKASLSKELATCTQKRQYKEPCEGLDTTLIEPDLLKKITHMKISPTTSVSDTSSISFADATVSDNESFTLGSTSNGALGTSGLNDGDKIIRDNGPLPQSDVPGSSVTALTIPDFQLQEDLVNSQMVKSFEDGSFRRGGEDLGRGAASKRDRPSSLLGLPTSELLSLGSSLVSPETPQGDSTFLEIQYDPLSDTTEPSTPSETNPGDPSMDSVENLSEVQSSTKQTSPLSPDISSSSTDDPIDNAPMYENVEIGSSVPLTRRLLDGDETNIDSLSSSSKPSPEAETPTPADSDYENIKYQNLELSPQYDSDPKNIESETVTPCYENIEEPFLQDYENVETKDREDNSYYENVGNSPDAYEEYNFSNPAEYENLEFPPTDAEIEGEMVYQQVKYLKQTIQEVNVILANQNEEKAKSKDEPLIEICTNEGHPVMEAVVHQVTTERKVNEKVSSDNTERFQSDGSECLESPITPSSSSVITEMLVLPSFSSPTESTTEEITSPDASETHSMSLANGVTSHPRNTSPSISSVSPLFPPLIPSLSPPSPETHPHTCLSNAAKKNLAKKDSASPITKPKPKPRSLPSLNLSSPIVSPLSPISTSSSISPDSPASAGTSSDYSPLNPAGESSPILPFSSQVNPTRCSIMPCKAELSSEKEETSSVKSESSSSSCPKVPLSHSAGRDASTSAPGDGDSLKRERIDKIKEERRSILRKKFPSESFKGEKDEMILRLKQKATSPSRQIDADSSTFAEIESTQTEPLAESETSPEQPEKKLVSPDLSLDPHPASVEPATSSSLNEKSCEIVLHDKIVPHEKHARFQSSEYAYNRNIFDKIVESSGSDVRKEKPSALQRSISEDLKPNLSVTRKFTNATDKPQRSLSTSNKPNISESHVEPNYNYKKVSKESQDDDVNVRERVAIWNRQKETGVFHNKLPLHKINGSPSEPKALSPVKITPQPFFGQPIKPEKPRVPGMRKSLSSLPTTSITDKPSESKLNNTSIARLQKVYDTSPNKKDTSYITQTKPFKPPSPSAMGETIYFSKSDKKEPRGIHSTKTEKSSSAKLDPKIPAVHTKSAPHSPKRTSPVMLSQKSESDLHTPITLRTTRSYSVGSSITGVTKAHPPPILTHGHHKKIKDIAARFEKDPTPPSLGAKPPILRQSSKD